MDGSRILKVHDILGFEVRSDDPVGLTSSERVYYVVEDVFSLDDWEWALVLRVFREREIPGFQDEDMEAGDGGWGRWVLIFRFKRIQELSDML